MKTTPRPRIVSLAPSVTHSLFQLGAAENLVGLTRWCKDIVPDKAIGGLPIVGDCWDLNVKVVAELKPDVVIGSVPYRAQTVESILASGLRFLGKSPRTLDDIYGDIRLLAGIVNKKPAGEALADAMQSQVEAVRKLTTALANHPRVYCEIWPNPLRNAEPWVEELVDAAGGRFVPRPAGRQVRSEEVIASNPEIIVLAWTATGDRARPDILRKRRGWEKISAVKNNRIYVIRDEILNTPAAILLEGLNALATVIHPDPESPEAAGTG